MGTEEEVEQSLKVNHSLTDKQLVALLDICPNELKTMSTPKPAPKCF